MALKATKLIREALALEVKADALDAAADLQVAVALRYRAASLLIEARDWADRHHQPRLASTARRLQAANFIRRDALRHPERRAV